MKNGNRSADRRSVPVVVIGLDSVTGLHAARIFSARGVSVVGIAADASHPCCRTNACERVVIADTGGPKLVETLLRIGSELGGRAVLVPCTDLSVLIVSRHRNELGHFYCFSLPESDVVEMLVDKASFYAFARENGFPIPQTFFLRSEEEAVEAARLLNFPAILKPALKTPEWQRRSSAKAYRAVDAAELVNLYRRLSGWTSVLIAQEWIAGSDSDHYTCNCYFSRASEPLVTFATRKLRQWPAVGGEACLSVESRDDTVVNETVRLFRAVSHRGFGYLEMKRDSNSGQWFIIEPNIGRPTGRSAAAEASGVDLLYTMYCDVLGLPLPSNRQQRYTGTKWIHLRRDTQAAITQWWRGNLSAAEWFRSLRGRKVEALFSWSDPAPFAADLIRATTLVLPRIRGQSKRVPVANE